MKLLFTVAKPWLTVLLGSAVLVGSSVLADTLEPNWALAPNDRLYITTGNLERGAAINPVTGNVLLLGRSGGPQVYVLSGTDGSDDPEGSGEARKLSQNDADGNPIITGGTFTMNLVGVAADGVVYVCNLSTAATPLFKVYRWGSDATDVPVALAYGGDPSSGKGGSGSDIRFGDNFAVGGSGVNTRLVASARNGKYLALFTTTDGTNFTAQTLTTDALGKLGLGLTFGPNGEVWGKVNGAALVRLQLDLVLGLATTIATIPTAVIPAGVTGIGYDPTSKLLAVTDYSAHALSAFDVSEPTAPIRLGDPLPLSTSNANGNGTAAAAVVGLNVVGLDTNNGLLAAKVKKSVIADPPVIDPQPADITAYAGATVTFGFGLQGTPPFTYRWQFKDAPLTDKTSAQLTLTAITPTDGGPYNVVVGNSAGTTTSSNATLVVKVPLTTPVLTPLWSLPPGSRDYINTDNTQRGAAINPKNGDVLLVSRTGGDRIIVLDGATGAFKHQLNTLLEDGSPIGGGTYNVNLVGVTDDGVVYVCNLTTDGAASPFRLYRWADDSPATVPAMFTGLAELAELSPDGATGYRWGDTLDVRGASPNEQIAIASRNHKRFAILSGFDAGGAAKVFDVDGIENGNLGLGISFGKGDTLWGTANGSSLVHLGFDLNQGTATVLQNYPGSQFPTAVGPIAVDPANDLLAGVAFETPDNVQAYDLANLDAPPVLLDQELLFVDQLNINGTGALDFSGNKLIALDSNNGLYAYTVKKELPPAEKPTLSAPKITGANFEFTLTGEAGRTYIVQRSRDLKSWAALPSIEVPLTTTSAVVPVPMGSEPMQFVRAVVK